MGTRGAIGFRLKGEDKVTYNHYDSYPSELGKNMLSFVAGLNTQQPEKTTDYLRGEAARLVPVREDSKPTAQQKKELKTWTDLTVSKQSSDDWYCVLRDTQGDPNAMLKARYFIDSSAFLMDGLFCEYAYIINLDDDVLEFYTGFHKTKGVNRAGRYWPLRNKKDDYGPVALKAVIPLGCILKDDVEGFVKLMERADKLKGGRFLSRSDDGLWLERTA